MSATRTRAVLIVDDDPDMREVMWDVLAGAGYEVFQAPDGEPALQRLRESQREMVVLLDVSMPGMDGIAVIQAVAAYEALANRHVFVMVTAWFDQLPSHVASVLRRMGIPILAKPFDIDELVAVVQAAEQILDAGRRSLSPDSIELPRISLSFDHRQRAQTRTQ